MDAWDKILLAEMKKKQKFSPKADSYSLAYVCLLKSNIKKFQLSRQSLDRNVYFSMIIFFVQIAMQVGMVMDMN